MLISDHIQLMLHNITFLKREIAIVLLVSENQRNV